MAGEFLRAARQRRVPFLWRGFEVQRRLWLAGLRLCDRKRMICLLLGARCVSAVASKTSRPPAETMTGRAANAGRDRQQPRTVPGRGRKLRLSVLIRLPTGEINNRLARFGASKGAWRGDHRQDHHGRNRLQGLEQQPAHRRDAQSVEPRQNDGRLLGRRGRKRRRWAYTIRARYRRRRIDPRSKALKLE